MKPQIEPIDDIAVIFSMIKKMNIIEALDRVFIPHGNWTGITVGELTSIWLCYLISTQDHRLSYFEDWAKVRLHIIGVLLSKEVTIYDFSDDKLELLLGYFSSSSKWNGFEYIVDNHVIRIFDLETEILRVDATVGKSFSTIIKGGLFQHGNSKQFRKDLGQFKTMLCTLDPMGYPLTNMSVSGNSADDPLYIPVIAQAMKRLTQSGSMFVGDCKLGSLETRAFVEKNEHYYLCPLSAVQVNKEDLGRYIDNIEREQIEQQKIRKDGQIIAKGYSFNKLRWFIDDQEELIIWQEQLYIIRSYAFAKTQIEAFVKRIKRCINDLLALNISKQGKKTFNNLIDLTAECQRIIKQYKMQNFINFEIEEQVIIKHVRKWKERPAREEKQINYQIKVEQNNACIAQEKKVLGWRVYASNCTSKDLTVEKVTLLYRKEYIIERRFDCLKNKPLNLIPLYLRKDEYVLGLINILLLALKVITLIEFSVARNLEKSNKQIAGLYVGNPKHKTQKPSASLILKAFLGIYCIAAIDMKNTKIEYQVTSLNPLQKKLLRLMNMPETIYTNFDKTVRHKQNNTILKN